MSIVEFLSERIAEDESAARYAQTRDAVNDGDWAGWWYGHHAHYSRYNPARTLDECLTKRAIVGLHAPWHVCESVENEGATDYVGGEDDSGGQPCPTLRMMAGPYMSHQDFRQEWAW